MLLHVFCQERYGATWVTTGGWGSGRTMNASRAKFTVLVVEDEWLLRMELADELQAAGWKVLEAASGQEALIVLAAEPKVDFLITDIRLGSAADGWDVADAFRKGRPDGAVMMSTLPV